MQLLQMWFELNQEIKLLLSHINNLSHLSEDLLMLVVG